METILLVVHVIIAAALIGVVLIQRSDSDGFGMGAGSNANLMSGRASANLMTRSTAILATLFILNSLALSIIASGSSKSTLVETIREQEAEESAPAVPVDGEAVKEAVEEVIKAVPAVPEAE